MASLSPEQVVMEPARSRLRQGLQDIADRLELQFEKERDQLPLWFPVGLGSGIAAWFALPDARTWAAFMLAAVACGLAVLAVGAGTRWGRALAIFAFAASIG